MVRGQVSKKEFILGMVVSHIDLRAIQDNRFGCSTISTEKKPIRLTLYYGVNRKVLDIRVQIRRKANWTILQGYSYCCALPNT